MKAHHHFSDPEWDGEPTEPELNISIPRSETLTTPLSAREPSGEYTKRQTIKVKLADGKARMIQHMMATSFRHPDGTPMSTAQFMETLFGKLPEFFKDEEALRAIWSTSDTRRKLLDGLAEKGGGRDQLAEMQKIICRSSDLL